MAQAMKHNVGFKAQMAISEVGKDVDFDGEIVEMYRSWAVSSMAPSNTHIGRIIVDL